MKLGYKTLVILAIGISSFGITSPSNAWTEWTGDCLVSYGYVNSNGYGSRGGGSRVRLVSFVHFCIPV